MTWYELTHDRLIEPIRADNESFREQRLSRFQQQALLWDQGRRPDNLLLRDKDLAEAERWVAASIEPLTPLEEGYLNESRQLEAASLEATRHERRRWIIILVSIFAAIMLSLGLLAAYQWWQAERLSNDLRIEWGLSYCEQGEIGPGLLWLSSCLEALPTRSDRNLERVLRMQLSSWRRQLHELRERWPHERPVWAVAFNPDGKLTQ